MSPAIPNTQRVADLQKERVSLLDEKRRWEKARVDAARNESLADDRLRVVEAALEGVELGVGHAAEVAASKEGQGK